MSTSQREGCDKEFSKVNGNLNSKEGVSLEDGKEEVDGLMVSDISITLIVYLYLVIDQGDKPSIDLEVSLCSPSKFQKIDFLQIQHLGLEGFNYWGKSFPLPIVAPMDGSLPTFP